MPDGGYVCETTIRPKPPMVPKHVAYGGLLPVTCDEVAGFNNEFYFEHSEKVKIYEGEGAEVI